MSWSVQRVWLPGPRERHAVRGDGSALPHDPQLRGVLLGFAVDGHDDVGEDRAQQLLAFAIAGGGRVEHLAQVRACVPAPRDLLVGQRVRASRGDVGKSVLGVADLGEPLLPLALERARDEPVLRLARVELVSGAFGVDLRALELQLSGVHSRLVV